MRHQIGPRDLLATVAVGLLLGAGAACLADSDISQPPVQSAATPTTRPAIPGDTVERLKVKVVSTLPHDPRAFTQGLVLDGGVVHESTGQYGQSTLQSWDRRSGRILRRVDLAPDVFAEGLALVADRLVQLTWHRGVAFVYDRASLDRLASFRYRGEGWGLTYDGEALVMSDGSDLLSFRDPDSFATLRQVRVTLKGRPLEKLNELEWVDGRVFANVWTTDSIVRIHPDSGVVEAVIDASGLLSAAERRRTDVLNGIAYDVSSGHLLLTGKLWPKVFEVELVPVEGGAAGREQD